MAAGAFAWARPPRELKFSQLKFVPPAVQKMVLKSGATVFLLPDHELPLINLTVAVKTGSMFEPSDKAGAANMTAALMRGGGTELRSREAIDEELEFIGASAETGMDIESANASLNCLTKDFSKTLGILAEILSRPAFDPQKLELEKARQIEGIRRRNDEPFQIARREFRKAIYGPTHPLSRVLEISSVKVISREDLQAFHKKYYSPANMMIAVSGDFETADMVNQLESAFSGWGNGVPVLPKAETVPEGQVPGTRHVVYAEKSLNQCSVIVGHLGIKRHNPDRFALEVMNDILGGNAFSSRLYKEVRSRLGLAYWVGSNFSEPYDYGVMASGSQTKSGTVGLTVKTVLSEMEKITKGEVSPAELQLAKDSIVNSFVFRYNSPHAIVSQTMSMAYYGFAPDYLETYTQKINQVSAADVLAAAKKILHPEKMSIIIVGNKKDFDEKLENFGAVTNADLSIKE